MPRKKKSQSGNKINQHVFLATTGVFFLLIFLLLSNFNFFNTKKSSDMRAYLQSGDSQEVVLVLDFGGKARARRFKTLFREGETRRAWSLLQQASAYAGFELKITGNFIPVEISGVAADEDGGTWQLYVNNQKKDLKPFNVFIKGGDETVYRYE